MNEGCGSYLVPCLEVPGPTLGKSSDGGFEVVSMTDGEVSFREDYCNVGITIASPPSVHSSPVMVRSASYAVQVEPRRERSLLSRIGSWFKCKGKRKVEEVDDLVKAALAHAHPILDERSESSPSKADSTTSSMPSLDRRSIAYLEVLDVGTKGEYYILRRGIS